MRCVELLAPAKDLDCGRAAIDCGADAVYIGAPRFGARVNAGNTLDDIAALVEYGHRYWARVYVTVNTLLHDAELADAEKLIAHLHAMGVDGVILQDMGLLECDLPPVPLIASTQVHNASPEKVAFLEKVGFQRVILARELDLDQLGAIRRACNVELECFVHGALCVGYSGQCYMSYALGGRSGNRGACAQPCRKSYTVLDQQDNIVQSSRHWLSLHDLNLSAHLRSLLDVGITSFKIEGRLKDRAYVSNVVAAYRAQLDPLLKEMGLRKSSSGVSTPGFSPDLDKTFNRGYTTYFLQGKRERVGFPDSPKMRGSYLGEVVAVDRWGVTLDTKEEIHSGDGVCFFDGEGRLGGTTINVVNGATLVPEKWTGLKEGVVLYRNHDHVFMTQLRKCRPSRRIPIQITVQEREEGVFLAVQDTEGTQVELFVETMLEPAKKAQQALDSLQRQLKKTGDTEFQCTDVVVNWNCPRFFPLAVVNQLRRTLLETLRKKREEDRPVIRGGLKKNDVPYPDASLDFHGNVLNQRAREFYQRHGVTQIEPAAESGLELTGRKIMTSRYCLRHQLGLCAKETGEAATPLVLCDDEGHRLEARFICSRCEMEIYLQS